MTLPVVLSIAGSDSGGGAGIQADMRTFIQLGVFGTTAITAITAQNPECVSAIHALSPELLYAQLSATDDYFLIKAAKTGMLGNMAIAEVVAKWMEEHPHIPMVVDPVLLATSGSSLLDEKGFHILKTSILPRASVVTPNLPEAVTILNSANEIKQVEATDKSEMVHIAEQLRDQLNTHVLLKGGHLDGDELCDVLAYRDRSQTQIFDKKRIEDVHTHGTGCMLSAALTAFLAHGDSIKQAIEKAENFIDQTFAQASFPSGRSERHLSLAIK